MVQIVKEEAKEITEKQTAAIQQIIQNRDFTLSEYKKLKRILDARVVTRKDASAFLEYCYAKVRYERYFNGHKHNSYAACCYCKSRDHLMKIKYRTTGQKRWCCRTCRSRIGDDVIVDVARTNKKGQGSAEEIDEGYIRAQLNSPQLLYMEEDAEREATTISSRFGISEY